VEHDIKGMLTKNRHKSNGHMSTIWSRWDIRV
jgi:hypothetical protein